MGRIKNASKWLLNAMAYGGDHASPYDPITSQPALRAHLMGSGVMLCGAMLIGFAMAMPAVVIGVGLFAMTWPLMEAWSREGRSVRSTVDLRTNSWAFLIGDLVLITAIGVLADAWKAPLPSTTKWVFVLVGLAATAVGVRLFRYLDRKRYVKHNAMPSYNAPSKLGYDFDVVPPLMLGLLAGSGPLVAAWTWHGWVMLGCVAVWALLGLADLYRDARGWLDPVKQHPAWDAEKFQLATKPE